MKEKLIGLKKEIGVYGILAVLQYFAAVFFNFRYISASVESDSAKLYRHAIEMSKNHALYIKGWSNATTMEWDSAAILAAPFYSLTHNIYISVALANTVLLLFFLFLVFVLFKRFNQPTINIMKAYNLFLIPYGFGMLEYFNMMFFGGSQYIFRLILPVTFIIIMKTEKGKRLRPLNIILCAFAAVMFLIAASSSGIYILVSCAMPLFVVVLLDAILSDNFKSYDLYQYAVCVCILVCAGIGVVLNKSIGGGELGNTMSLLRWYDWRYYADAFVEGYFRIMGAMPGMIEGDEVAVMSLRGFAFLLKFVISILVLIVMVVAIKQTVFKGKRADIRYYLAGISFVNLAMLLVCETRYSSLNSTLEARYLLPVIVPILLIIPIQLELWKDSWSKYLQIIVSVVFAVGTVFVTAVGYVDAHDALDQYAFCDEIVDYVKESGYTDVIFVEDRPDAEVCRLKDLDHTYVSYIPGGPLMDVVDFYQAQFRPSYYNPEGNLLFVMQGTDLSAVLNPNILPAYTYRDSILWFDIYESHEFVLLPPEYEELF